MNIYPKSLFLFLILMFFYLPAFAVISVDNVSKGDANRPASLTVSHTTSGSDRLMLVGVSIENEGNESVSTLTYGGTSLSLIDSSINGKKARIEIWGLIAPAVGNADVVVTFNNRVDKWASLGVATFTGVDQTTPTGSFASRTGQSDTPSVSISSASGELAFAVMAAIEQNGTATAGGGVTDLWNDRSSQLVGVGGTKDGEASVSMSWSLKKEKDWAIGGVSIKPSIVSSPVTVVVSYQFDESVWNGISGEVVDSSSNNYHATAINGPTTAKVSSAIPGNPGTCSYGVFDGINDYVAPPVGFPNLTADFTITAWIRTTNNTRSGQRILIDDQNNTQGFGFSLGDGGSGRLRFFSRSTNPVSLDTPNVVANNTWYFVAAVADMTRRIKTIYVYDQAGTQLTATSGSYTGTFGFDAGDASIGGENNASGESGSNYRFVGNIDEVMVHGAVLSEAQISAQQNASRACFNPVAEYRFDLCSETNTVIDDSGFGFNGVVRNGPLAIQTGKICNGAYFDGVNDYVEINDSALFDNTDKLTLAGWIKPENIRVPPAGTNARGIISKRNDASSAVSFGIFFYSSQRDGKIYIDIDGTNNRFSSNATIPENVWTHFAVVFDGSLPAAQRVTLYINGVLDRVAYEASSFIPNYNSNLYLGNLYYGPSELKVFQGAMDEIRILPEAYTSAEIVSFYNETRGGCQSCAATIDHYRFYHDGTGLTCSTEDVQIKACLDSSCSTEYVGPISATLGPAGWVGGSSQSIVSGATLQLWNPTAGAANLQIGGSSAEFNASNPTRCFIGAIEQADCHLLFNDAGFIFNVSDHVADLAQSLTVSAVRKDLITQQCVPGFQNVNRDVQFWSTYLDPLTGTLPVRINGAAISGSGPGTTRTLSFNSAGVATIGLQYADVGQMSLNASYQGAGDDAGLVMTGADNFITRPDHFALTLAGNPAAADATGGVFKKAGETFQVRVEARNASDVVAPNFGNEAAPESVRLVNSLVAPAGQTNPALAGNFNSFGTACDGSSAAGVACGNFNWNEVGIIRLLPGIGDGNYLGSGDVTGTSTGNLGRFVPARLSVTANAPMFSHGCLSGGFTYLGQPFSLLIDPVFTLTALGSGGTVLNNYGNSFWKYAGALSGRNYTNASAVSAALSLTTAGSSNLSGTNDYDGTGTVALVGDQLTFAKPVAAVAPFAGLGTLTLPAADLTDTDGACYDPDMNGICDTYNLTPIGSTEQRYGKLVLQNAYGPETLAAGVPLSVEFFDGSAYVTNFFDDCTSYAAANLVLSNYQLSLTSGDTTASGSGVLSAGLGSNLSLSAPGNGHDGSVDLLYDLDAAGLGWLKTGSSNPTSKVTFGIYKGNERLIYLRESVQ